MYHAGGQELWRKMLTRHDIQSVLWVLPGVQVPGSRSSSRRVRSISSESLLTTNR